MRRHGFALLLLAVICLLLPCQAVANSTISLGDLEDIVQAQMLLSQRTGLQEPYSGYYKTYVDYYGGTAFVDSKLTIYVTDTSPAVIQELAKYPGVNIKKDPKVTVEADSEACWLFVKVVKDGTFVDGKVSYSVDTDKWTLVPGQNNVYYRAVTEAEAKAGVSYYVLKGDATYTDGVITVSNTLTKEDIKNITTKPTLTFTAYAVQQAGFDTAEAAWAEAAKLG